ncbi:MAG TPA: hypothetical protein P5154_07240 [Candidatus Izemoplasmatales bacterium]|nr:hypothetical protein [Bacillota bacterium]HRY78538.1 hypothetical protein [Candidatus Izemoplasmatales bacterium]
MNALIIVLNETSLMDDLVSGLLELGVNGATILDSQGMGSAIVHGDVQVPLFGSLRSLLSGEARYSKTLFTVIEDDRLLHQAIAAARRILGKRNRPGVGFLFTVPVGTMSRLGLRPEGE